jgi:4-amino-4-deoxy-L-arabinose transferase-like glycosyltransferase
LKHALQTRRSLLARAPARFVPTLTWAALGALLILLLSQIPATHVVDVGGFDAAYTQGFFDAERPGDPGGPRPYLEGAEGGARWSGASAALIFPQAGLPGEVGLRLRGWRESGPPPQVILLLNGVTELDRFQASGAWEERRVPIRGGWLKATDFFIEIRADTTRLADGRETGVLVDRAVYRVGPGLIAPYPTQLAYAAAVGALLWTLLRTGGNAPRERMSRAPAAALLAYGLAWLLLYRLQPPLSPYPLRALPPLTVLTLGGLLALREGPALAARWPRLVSVAAPIAVIGLWTTATLVLAQRHVTLSRPGVENDFRVFATRDTLAGVFQADGFYNLGYPLLLWLARPFFEGNAFLAGRFLAALSGAALLAAGYWLARVMLPPGPALLALLALALNGLVARYGLYVSSDMPFAACVILSVAALAAALGKGSNSSNNLALTSSPSQLHGPVMWRARAAGIANPEPGRTASGPEGRATLWLAAIAGFAGGLAFLMRHPGLILLPWGAIALLLAGRSRPRGLAAIFASAMLAAMLPQLIVNTIGTGNPLYNQQAKNIWLAVYGNTDWGRWEEAPNDIGLAEVVLRDPARFLENWWRNVIGYTGSGAEDTSEFGRAWQLRLLGWPANWLAAGGLLGWLLLLIRRSSQDLRASAALLILIASYVALVSTAFSLQRFFLPLAPIYAVAAGWSAWRLARGGRLLLGASLALVVVLWGGYESGARYVLAQQPAEEVAAIRMVEAATAPGDPIAARVSERLPLAKYSAIAHRVVDWPPHVAAGAAIRAEDVAAVYAAGARYLLWDETAGPPPLADPDAARVSTSGRYGLYRLGTGGED